MEMTEMTTIDAGSLGSQLMAALQLVSPNVVGVSIGDVNDRGTWRVDFAAAAGQADRTAAAAAVTAFVFSTVPQEVTRRQARLALLGAGLLSAAEAAMASNPAYEIWYEDSPIWHRSDPVLLAVGAMLTPPLSAAQIDGLFIAASQL